MAWDRVEESDDEGVVVVRDDEWAVEEDDTGNVVDSRRWRRE